MVSGFNFTLYSGTRFFPWAQNDVSRLSKLCREFAGADYSIDIVRAKQEPRRAFLDGVFTTPTIFIDVPGRGKKHLGGFAETEKYLRQRCTEPQASPMRVTLAIA